MRILLWCCSLGDPTSAYHHWLVEGMRAIGHQVVAVNAHDLTSVFGIQKAQRLLLDYARAYRVNAVVLLPSTYVEPWFCEALRGMGVAIVALRNDDCMWAAPGKPAQARWILKQLSFIDPCCDLAVTVVPRAVDLLRDADRPVPVYVPHPVGWQAIPEFSGPKRPVIAFAGSPKQQPGQPPSWRVQAVRALLQASLPVEVHHDGWASIPEFRSIARPTPPVPDYYAVLGSSLVCLSPAGDWGPQSFPQLRLQTLEIAAAGSMPLAFACDELQDYFTVGEDLDTFTSLEELVAKARHYLANPELAATMGQRSRRAIERTGGWDLWWNRVAEMLVERGIRLDLNAPSTEPDPNDTGTLAMAAMALGHHHEVKGNARRAADYYQEVLRYDPDDYAAHAGLGRLAGTTAEAQVHWRNAATSIAYTGQVKFPPSFGMPGIDPEWQTAFRTKALGEWLQKALMLGDYEDALRTVPLIVEYDPYSVSLLVDHLAAKRRFAEAIQCCDAILMAWPEVTEMKAKRQTLLAAQAQSASP